jgi:hypothetical protein
MVVTNIKISIFLQCLNILVAKIYLELFNESKLEAAMGSAKLQKVMELEEVTIRKLFLENTIHIVTDRYL